MKKDNFYEKDFSELVVLAAILALAVLAASPMISTVRADGFKYDSSCDHWYGGWKDTYNDTFTAIGITGHYPSPGAFDYADFIFVAGTGGNYSPLAGSPMYCYWRWAQSPQWYSNS